MIRFRNVVAPVVIAFGLFHTACTDDAKNLKDPIEASKDPNAFKVDENTGKVEFEAEIVYFAYDDSSLTPEGMARLDKLASYMKEKAETKLSVAGHTDDRGSVEYNLALGQKRSDAVRKYLETVGIPSARVAVVSFGEEHPATTGSGEDNWSKNRRAEFTFSK